MKRRVCVYSEDILPCDRLSFYLHGISLYLRRPMVIITATAAANSSPAPTDTQEINPTEEYRLEDGGDVVVVDGGATVVEIRDY